MPALSGPLRLCACNTGAPPASVWQAPSAAPTSAQACLSTQTCTATPLTLPAAPQQVSVAVPRTRTHRRADASRTRAALYSPAAFSPVQIEEEDYTWSGDPDMDVSEDYDPSQAVVIDLTQPTFISDAGVQAEKVLSQAMQAVYQGQHTRATCDSSKLRGAVAGGEGVLPPVPPRYVGRVLADFIPGSGWGLKAATVLEPGDTLLISEPLALIVNNTPVMTPAVAQVAARAAQPPPPPPQGVPSGSDSDGGSSDSGIHQNANMHMGKGLGAGGIGGSGLKATRAALKAQLRLLQDTLPAHHPARLALAALWCGPAVDSHALSVPNPRPPAQHEPRRPVHGRTSPHPSVSSVSSYGDRSLATAQTVPDLRSWRPVEAPYARVRRRGAAASAVAGADDGSVGVAPTVCEDRLTARGLTDKELGLVVRYNAVIDTVADPVLSEMRGEAACVSVSGVWPELSLVNHSCVPNAVAVMVGGRMVVRATTQVLPNQEITVNYLGDSTLQPLEQRQRKLLNRWGFKCECPRCRVEAQAGPQFASLVSRALTQTPTLRTQMQTVLAQWHETEQKELKHWEHVLGEVEGSNPGHNTPLQQNSSTRDGDATHTSTNAGMVAVKQGNGQTGNRASQQLAGTASEQQQQQPEQFARARAVLASKVARRGTDGGLRPGLPDSVIDALTPLAASAAALLDEVRVSARVTAASVPYRGCEEWLMAGVGELQELSASLWHVLQPGSSRAHTELRAYVTSLSVALPGDARLAEASELLAHKLAARYGPSDRSAVIAHGESNRTHTARYGPLPVETLVMFTDASLARALYSSERVVSGHTDTLLGDTSHNPISTLTVHTPPRWAPPAWQYDAQRKADKRRARVGTAHTTTSQTTLPVVTPIVVPPQAAAWPAARKDEGAALVPAKSAGFDGTRVAAPAARLAPGPGGKRPAATGAATQPAVGPAVAKETAPVTGVSDEERDSEDVSESELLAAFMPELVLPGAGAERAGKQLAAPIAAAAEAPQGVGAPAKRRGRPRKTPVRTPETSTEVTHTTATVAVATPAKRRGRPRKTPISDAGLVVSGQAEAGVEQSKHTRTAPAASRGRSVSSTARETVGMERQAPAVEQGDEDTESVATGADVSWLGAWM